MLLTEGGILKILTEMFVTGLHAERQCPMEESRCRGSNRHTDDRACGRVEVVRSRNKTNKKNRERLESTSGKLKERKVKNNSTVQQF